ncbi:hypothetical protein OHQ88_05420 [Micromonospora zamorensis]|uniref:hypothetical protein n=1 Tax=Micromonospora zamorensis TaxID=709883 RepID=UPI002E231DCC|nr:hypothetical protein OG423_03790 [Micromonospora zamorensis]
MSDSSAQVVPAGGVVADQGDAEQHVGPDRPRRPGDGAASLRRPAGVDARVNREM